MICENFVYYRPSTLQEAVDAHSRSKSAVYYSGGSETITMCRWGDIAPDAVIDIKGIPECGVLFKDDQSLHIGAACTLNQIGQSKTFPLMALAAGRIADHTNQCRITLGGNLCGRIMYRETSLPLLLAEAEVTLFGPEGRRDLPFESVFDGRMNLLPGEMIIQVHVPAWALAARHFHIKKTANEKIDYPLLSASALVQNDALRIAFSGVWEHPFRDGRIEEILNDRTRPIDRRAEDAARFLSQAMVEDVRGSAKYRRFMLNLTLRALLKELENDML